MIYIHYFNEEVTTDGCHHKQGEIYYISDFSTGAENCVQVTFDEAKKHDLFDYLYIDGKLIYDADGVAERHLDELRVKREGLLLAFDKYKSNVIIGIEKDISMSEEVLNWYQAILDLNEEAINSPPERIKYYLN